MSFLAEAGTLEDVLAFIDDCQDAKREQLPSPSLLQERQSIHAPRFTASQIKDELLHLRQQTKWLENQLLELQTKPSEDRLVKLQYLKANRDQSFEWIDATIREYQRRKKAERTNSQLKALLAKQLQMIRGSELAFGVFTHEVIAS